VADHGVTDCSQPEPGTFTSNCRRHRCGSRETPIPFWLGCYWSASSIFALPLQARIRITGVIDLRRSSTGLSAGADEAEQDSFSGHVLVFRGRRDLIKVLWHDGLCLFAKQLGHSRVVWPQATGGRSL
jgi:transposase